MELTRTFVQSSPDNEGRVRVCGEVTYDHGGIQPELLWFDVPTQLSDHLSFSGNPWLAALLPLAMHLGEPLRLYRSVDRTLYDNVHELMRIEHCWHPNTHLVHIEGDSTPAPEQQDRPRTAAFFSGGVDSFFSVLWHQEPHDTFKQMLIDDLLFVWGFDVPVENRAAFHKLWARNEQVAVELGKNLIYVGTNIRATQWRRIKWGKWFVFAMAAAGLALENRFGRLLIPSGMDYGNMAPLGSHPLTDHLLSTRHTQVIHDGVAFNRLEKTRFLARSEVALRNLRVCWRSQSDENCGACEKCYRTMLALELLGALDRCSTFRGKRLDWAKIPKVYADNTHVMDYYREMYDYAASVGQDRIARAVKKVLRRNRRLHAWIPRIRRLHSTRFFWRLVKPLERALLAGSVQ
jgi:hypothetical protein